MNKLFRDFKKYGWKGLALTLSFVAGMATTTKSAKAASYCTNGYCDIRLEETTKGITTSNNAYADVILTTPITNKVPVVTSAPVVKTSQITSVPEATVVPADSLQNQTLKMYYNDEELEALGKEKNSCGDNYALVTPVEQIASSNTRATNEIVEADPQTQKLSRKNLDGTVSTVQTYGNETASKGNSATTSPNGITTVVNSDGTATIYQNVNGVLMKRTIEVEGTINNSPAEGQFTAEGEYNIAWEKSLLYPNRETNMGVDGVFQNSEGSTVIVTNDGQTITTIDHSTGGVYTTTCSIATAEGQLARAAYYGVPYYEYMSSKGHYDAGTTLQLYCNNGMCTLGSAEEFGTAYTL